MTQQTGIAGVVESASTEHNAQVAHRWDDLDYVRGVIANGGSYNALEVLKALEKAIDDREYWKSRIREYVSHDIRLLKKRRRALMWLVAERRRRRELQEFVRELNNT